MNFWSLTARSMDIQPFGSEYDNECDNDGRAQFFDVGGVTFGNNPAVKVSPSLKRLISTFGWKDTCVSLNIKDQFTRYYITDGVANASRLDRSYTFGTVSPINCSAVALPFSDHLGFINEIDLGDTIIPEVPRTKPLFKSKPWVIQDRDFISKHEHFLPIWKRSLEGRVDILLWWDVVFKNRLKMLMIEHGAIMARH